MPMDMDYVALPSYLELAAMDDDPPKVAKRLESARLFMAVWFLLLAVSMWDRHWLLSAFQLVVGLLLLQKQLRVLSTQVDSTGVAQWTWRGRTHLRWSDVTSVQRGNRSVELEAAGAKVILPIESFYDSTAATEYLNSHLPARFI